MGGGWDAGLSQAKLTGLILVAVNGAPATITIETCEDPGDWTTAVGGAGWASHGGGGAFLGFSRQGRSLPERLTAGAGPSRGFSPRGCVGAGLRSAAGFAFADHRASSCRKCRAHPLDLARMVVGGTTAPQSRVLLAVLCSSVWLEPAVGLPVQDSPSLSRSFSHR